MAKTLGSRIEITPQMREDYLRALGAHFCRPRGKTYGISSSSKERKITDKGAIEDGKCNF